MPYIFLSSGRQSIYNHLSSSYHLHLTSQQQMENESLIHQYVDNFFPFGAFLPSLTFLKGIDRWQIYLSSIHCLCSSGICILHHSASLWDGVQSTGSGNTFIFFQPKSATERLLKRSIITQIRGSSFPLYLSSLKDIICPFSEHDSLLQAEIPVCQRRPLAMRRSSSPLFSYGSLIPMPTPEESVHRGSTRELSGLFMHLKVLLRFQIIQVRALSVALTRCETLRVICFVEKMT